MNLRNLTPDESEVFYDCSINVYQYVRTHNLSVNSRALPNIALYLAMRFQEIHKDTDWNVVEYIESVDNFVETVIPACLTLSEEEMWKLTESEMEAL
jgi:hypothetical protein